MRGCENNRIAESMSRVIVALFPDLENKVEHLNLKRYVGPALIRATRLTTQHPPPLSPRNTMELPPTRDLAIAAGAAFAAVFTLYHIREQRSRTHKIQRADERVLILGASSGVGRTLAHMYAQRGARVCVVGRRRKEIEEVELECKTIQRIKESEEDRNAFSVCADFADPEQMIMLRDVIQAGEFASFIRSIFGRYFLMFVSLTRRMARCRYRCHHCGSDIPSTPTVRCKLEAR